MAIIQNPITGRMSGNISNTRFGVWRGKNVAASIGLKEQRKPQTLSAAVILNRAKMALSGHTMISMVSFANKIYPVSLIGTTPFADILKFFRKKLIGTVGALLLDITQLVNTAIGNGLAFTMPFSIGGTARGALPITYLTGAPGPHFSMDANIVFLVVNDTFTTIKYIDPGITLTGGAGALTINLSSDFKAGENVFIFAGVYEDDTFTANVLRTSRLTATDAIAFTTLT